MFHSIKVTAQILYSSIVDLAAVLVWIGLKIIVFLCLRWMDLLHTTSWCSIHHAVLHSFSLCACCGPGECSLLIVSVGTEFVLHSYTAHLCCILKCCNTAYVTHASPLTLSSILAKRIPTSNSNNWVKNINIIYISSPYCVLIFQAVHMLNPLVV